MDVTMDIVGVKMPSGWLGGGFCAALGDETLTTAAKHRSATM
jgi:hypothetical protein